MIALWGLAVVGMLICWCDVCAADREEFNDDTA